MNCLLAIVGFVLSVIILTLSQIGDVNKRTHKLDAASLVPAVAFLLSLIGNSMLLVHFQRQKRANVH